MVRLGMRGMQGRGGLGGGLLDYVLGVEMPAPLVGMLGGEMPALLVEEQAPPEWKGKGVQVSISHPQSNVGHPVRALWRAGRSVGLIQALFVVAVFVVTVLVMLAVVLVLVMQVAVLVVVVVVVVEAVEALEAVVLACTQD
jgi:hypothetical protein